MLKVCCVKLLNVNVTVRENQDPQAEAVLLRDSQHFPLEFLTWLSKRDHSRKCDGPPILPIKAILKLQLGGDRRTNDWAVDTLVFQEKRGRAVQPADLQDDPDGSFVAVRQGWGGGSGQLGQRGQAEQKGPSHQSPAHSPSS